MHERAIADGAAGHWRWLAGLVTGLAVLMALAFVSSAQAGLTAEIERSQAPKPICSVPDEVVEKTELHRLDQIVVGG